MDNSSPDFIKSIVLQVQYGNPILPAPIEVGDHINGVKVLSVKELGLGWLPILSVTSRQKFTRGQIVTIHRKYVTPKYVTFKDLKEPYYRLFLRRMEYPMNTINSKKMLNQLVDFSNTVEGHAFWWEVLTGGSPEIPAKSLSELDSEFVKPIIKT